MYTKFWLGNLKGRDHSEDLDIDGENYIKMDFKEIDWESVDWTR
jgi:hypothetical protein